MGDIDQAEFNEDYENALKVNMMTRLKSHMTSKMTEAIEQERALMVEQQTFDNAPPNKSSFMSSLLSLSRQKYKSEEVKKEQLESP